MQINLTNDSFMKYKKLTDYSTNKQNPFLRDTVHHIEKGDKQVIMSTKEPDLIIDSDGVVKGHTVFVRKTKVDKARFTKIFLSGVSAFYDLSKSAMKVFGYIVNSIKPNSDSFNFDLDDCKEFTGYSAKNTIFNALAELAENKIIARGKNPYHYYINPTFFFNGDRLSLLEQYVIIDTQNSEKALPNNQTNLFEDKKPISDEEV